MNEYLALQRQQSPPKDTQQLQSHQTVTVTPNSYSHTQQLQSQKSTETQRPPAATTPESSNTTYVTTGQILEGQRAPNNGSGVTEIDSGRLAVISADDNHHANADLAQWKCFEDNGLAERRFYNDHGYYHVSCSKSPTNNPPFCTSEDPDDVQGASPTVVSP